MKKRYLIAGIFTGLILQLTHHIWLGSHGDKHFDLMVMLIILICGFLLGLKLTSYLADFKYIKHKSRIEIIFLAIFFVLSIIPSLHINKAEVSKAEKRTLATYQPLIQSDFRINTKYGKDFESFFNDRFNCRQNLIDMNSFFRYWLNVNYYTNCDATLYKKDNLMYRNAAFGLEPIEDEKSEVFNTYKSNIMRLKNYCDKNNIKLYILIVPRKIDFFDSKIADKRKYSPDPAEELIQYLQDNTSVNIIYPKQEMLKGNQNTPMYFKTDHHWTKKGAYIGYSELMKYICKDFKDVRLLKEDELTCYYDRRVSEWWNRKLNNGQTFNQLRLPKSYAKKILDTDYLYYKNPYKKDLVCGDLYNIKIYNSQKDDEFYYKNGSNKRVMIIANSFARNLAEFLPYSFRHTARLCDNYRYMQMKEYEGAIKEYKPDILVLNMHTAYMNRILNMYPNRYSRKED